MASVPISERLTMQVKEAATTPFRLQADQAREVLQEDPHLHRLLNYHYGATPEAYDHALALAAMDKRWVEKVGTSVTIIHNGVGFVVHSEPLLLANWKSCTLKLEDASLELQAHFETLFAPWARANQDKTTLESTLDNVFNQVTTLQRALEVMPSILNWVPQEYKDRMARKVEKAAPRKSADEIKAETLTPEALAALNRARINT